MCGRSSGTANSPLRVLYDGWSLSRLPFDSPALHLLEILEVLPDTIEPYIALPAPARFLPPGIAAKTVIRPVSDTPAGRLYWEQLVLPALARETGAQLLHTTIIRPPLLCPVPVLVSPADFNPQGFSSSITPSTAVSAPGKLTASVNFWARLGNALGRGGLVNAAAILWPSDLPDPVDRNGPPASMPLIRLPIRVHSAFSKPQTHPAGLPDSFILCPGRLSQADFSFLAETWRLVSKSLGDDWILLTTGLNAERLEKLRHLCRETCDPGQIENLSVCTPEQWAAATQSAGVILQISPVWPWGDTLLQALACGRPLAAPESYWSDARTGPAGYLAPVGDARGLSAAVITLLIEEPVAEQLSQAARLRSANWDSDSFGQRLIEIYARWRFAHPRREKTM